MLQVGLIIGSTRPNRFADIPARWLIDAAARRPDFRLTTLDLRDHRLPFFDEPASPMFTNGTYTHPEAEAWRRRVGSFDAFIATAAEYNHGPTAVLKNAFDSAWFEWQRKPIAFVGYGSVGGARAIETLRRIVIELQMAPLRHEVNIAFEPYLAVLQGGRALDDYDDLVQAREAMFDHLVWWGEALKAARAARPAIAPRPELP
ncbi:MAG TPA: NAD(P)H-dependent oxidoreductase [Stellaceae bacterium]|nr:NAD(P)H-dependent oxidoreductase [Stellaceae bacterium]